MSPATASLAKGEPQVAPAAPSALVTSRLICPACGSKEINYRPLSCRDCGWSGRIEGDILDFVDESQLTNNHHAEVAAQTAAVNAYYENESKITCHWDRLSATDLPAMIGTTGTVLDLGCGTGSAGESLKAAGATVIGADLSLPCLAVARRRLDAVVRVDAVRLPFEDGTFDAIVARGALHHMADPEAAVSEAYRVLKPGGRAVFLDPREHVWLEPIKVVLRADNDSFSDDHRAYTPKAYRELIESRFPAVSMHTVHPFGILIAHGLDLLPIPKSIPRRPLARVLLDLDRRLDRTQLRRGGHLLIAVAQKA